MAVPVVLASGASVPRDGAVPAGVELAGVELVGADGPVLTEERSEQELPSRSTSTTIAVMPELAW
ncbi:MAG TPA: hypothetical protein VF635_15815 [Propionibacteriaceae bacterium]